jgi:two-component system sensor histidine kinase HydH
MEILSPKKLYLPALSIVAGVVLLFALIGISTYRNLDRQKATALAALRNQGMLLLQALEAGARTGLMMPMWSEDSVDTLIGEIGRNESIAYIYLAEAGGGVSHHGGALQPEQIPRRPEAPAEEGRIQETVRSLPGGDTVYELAKRFHPELLSPRGGRPHRMMTPQGEAFLHSHAGDLAVVGLRMNAYLEARRADIQHAVLMAVVLLLLGSAVFFFIIVIQNSYLVDRTLKRTKDYTRQVLASMASGLIGIDPLGQVTSYNAQALELLGLDASRLRQAGIRELPGMPPAGVDAVFDPCAAGHERELLYRKPSGEKIPLALSIAPIPDDGGACQGAVIVLRDLTEIKRLEAQLRRAEKQAAIGRLAAGVAHEIRNPLSSIRGFAQFLGRSLKDRPREQDYAATMVAEVDRINGVVSNLLSLARPVEARPEDCSIPERIDHVLRLVADEARAREIRIRADVAPGLESWRADPAQLTQALLNLLLNALQAASPGGSVRIGAARDENGALRIEVSDDGPGIPAENLERIFDPFFTTRSHGTGLGLTIVQQIVEAHQGEIKAESPIGEGGGGCRFTVRLPPPADRLFREAP